MKPMLLIPPLVALAAGVGWFGSQRSSSASLEQANLVLKERIRLALADDAAGDDPQSDPSGDTKGKKPLTIKQWRNAADALISQDTGKMPDLRGILRLQQRIAAMSSQEIVAIMEEIAASDIPKKQSDALLKALAGVLAEKDPEAYLKTCSGQLGGNDSGMGWQMVSAYGSWIKKDLAAATAWMNKMIAEGRFEAKALDGKNRTRMNFEGALISALLASDSQSAQTRLTAMPENQRLEVVLQHHFRGLQSGTEKAYADLVRTCLSREQQANAFPQVENMATNHNGLEKVSTFLDTIAADEAERGNLANKAAVANLKSVAAAGKLDRATVDELRDWAAQQAPGAEDAITGRALAAISDPERSSLTTETMAQNFRESVELISALHTESGSDDLLVSFLRDDILRRYPQESSALAAKVRDEKHRTEILGKLARLLDTPSAE